MMRVDRAEAGSDRSVEERGPARPPLPDLPGLLRLQASAGNSAVTRHLQQTARHPTVGLAAGRPGPLRVQRIPTVSRVPAPTAVVHENRQLTPDYEQTNALLDRLVLEQGWKATDAWAYRFLNADPMLDLKYGPDLDLVGRCRQRLQTEMTIRNNAVRQLTGAAGADFGDVRMAGGTFVTTGNAVTLELLKNSETQLQGEISKYGLKVSGYVFKDYSMGGGPLQQGLRDSARTLSATRRDCDAKRGVFFKAQQAAEAEGRKYGPFVGAGPAFLEPMEAARKVWVEGEDAYHAACVQEQITYPVLAAYSTLDDAATQLQALAGKDSAALAESLYKTIDEKLKNIATVRAEVGDRFNPWKHPQIVALTKKQLGLPPWQERVLDEKAAAVRAGGDADNAAKVWAAVAIGLGLLGAIPSGGSTLLAGVAAASAAVGAAYSLNNLYEHYKDYSLAKAETGVTLDKAQAISQEEPSLMWLAFDLLDLGLNFVGAATAFKELRAAMAAAERGGVTGLKNLLSAVERPGVTMATKSRIVATAVERMGGANRLEEMLKTISDTLRAAQPAKGKEQLLQAIQEAAATLSKKRIIRFSPPLRSCIPKITAAIEASERPALGSASRVRQLAAEIAQDFEARTLGGMYESRYDFILLRDTDDITSVLVHEMSHRAQHIEKQLLRMGVARTEYQAMHMQREILLMLPDEIAAASPQAWLRTADDNAILEFIRSDEGYGKIIAAEAAERPSLAAAFDPKADAKLIEDWFLKGSAGK